MLSSDTYRCEKMVKKKTSNIHSKYHLKGKKKTCILSGISISRIRSSFSVIYFSDRMIGSNSSSSLRSFHSPESSCLLIFTKPCLRSLKSSSTSPKISCASWRAVDETPGACRAFFLLTFFLLYQTNKIKFKKPLVVRNKKTNYQN